MSGIDHTDLPSGRGKDLERGSEQGSRAHACRISTSDGNQPVDETDKRSHIAETVYENGFSSPLFGLATGYGAWSTGNITEEMIQQYLDHHRSDEEEDNSDFIME